jgi:hypothetical protein
MVGARHLAAGKGQRSEGDIRAGRVFMSAAAPIAGIIRLCHTRAPVFCLLFTGEGRVAGMTLVSHGAQRGRVAWGRLAAGAATG